MASTKRENVVTPAWVIVFLKRVFYFYFTASHQASSEPVSYARVTCGAGYCLNFRDWMGGLALSIRFGRLSESFWITISDCRRNIFVAIVVSSIPTGLGFHSMVPLESCVRLISYLPSVNYSLNF